MYCLFIQPTLISLLTHNFVINTKMYLRDAKQKMVDFETKLEDYKSKLLMSDEASPVVVTRINEHVICPLVVAYF